MTFIPNNTVMVKEYRPQMKKYNIFLVAQILFDVGIVAYLLLSKYILI